MPDSRLSTHSAEPVLGHENDTHTPCFVWVSFIRSGTGQWAGSAPDRGARGSVAAAIRASS